MKGRIPSSLRSNFSKVEEAEIGSLYQSLPAKFDWRDKNKVTPIKNQGQCGACWAFTTVATIESAWAIKHNEMLDLSEQQLVDCSSTGNYKNVGCSGGRMDIAYKYVVDNGIGTEANYPYHTKVCLFYILYSFNE